MRFRASRSHESRQGGLGRPFQPAVRCHRSQRRASERQARQRAATCRQSRRGGRAAAGWRRWRQWQQPGGRLDPALPPRRGSANGRGLRQTLVCGHRRIATCSCACVAMVPARVPARVRFCDSYDLCLFIFSFFSCSSFLRATLFFLISFPLSEDEVPNAKSVGRTFCAVSYSLMRWMPSSHAETMIDALLSSSSSPPIS